MTRFEPLATGPDFGASDHWIPVLDNRVIVVAEPDGHRAMTAAEGVALRDHVGEALAPESVQVVGRVEGESGAWWTVALPSNGPQDEIDRWSTAVGVTLEAADLRSLMASLDPLTWNIAGRAAQLADWFRDNQHCGRCGGPMERVANERSVRCQADGFAAYPRLSPAVIVLVEHPDGRALLARNVAWPVPMYSTLAGFVEPGESLEDTIHREIREEVGIEVKDTRYFGSQPWPFPNSLMLGFVAIWAAGEVKLAEDEILDAQWYTPKNLPMIPPLGSIARALIDDWVSRQA